MRLIGVYMGSFLALLGGCAAFGLYNGTDHQEVFNEAMLCEARGGAWVHDAAVPLCMTPEDGLLELVDGSFIAFTNADPWEQHQSSPLEGKELGIEGRGNIHEIDAKESGDQASRGSLSAEQTTSICEEKTITVVYDGHIASVDFVSWPESEKYRTAITRDVRNGVNFAGSYVVSTWGCGRHKGDACVGHAVVDAKTGEILLYGVMGKRTGEFSLESSFLTIQKKDGEELSWNLENGELVSCL